jgi:hypothetical protein
MSIFESKKKKKMRISQEKANEAKKLFQEFIDFAKKNKYLFNSAVYYEAYNKLWGAKGNFGIYYTEEQMDNTLKEMRSILAEYKEKENYYTDIVKENIEKMKEFVAKRKRFFVIEKLFKSEYKDNFISYGYSYNLRYNDETNSINCFAILSYDESGREVHFDAKDLKIREMSSFDFGEFADSRLSYMHITDVEDVKKTYKNLQEFYEREEEKFKPF